MVQILKCTCSDYNQTERVVSLRGDQKCINQHQLWKFISMHGFVIVVRLHYLMIGLLVKGLDSP